MAALSRVNADRGPVAGDQSLDIAHGKKVAFDANSAALRMHSHHERQISVVRPALSRDRILNFTETLVVARASVCYVLDASCGGFQTIGPVARVDVRPENDMRNPFRISVDSDERVRVFPRPARSTDGGQAFPLARSGECEG